MSDCVLEGIPMQPQPATSLAKRVCGRPREQERNEQGMLKKRET